jgi:CHASE3 domain sensor protein
MKHEDIFKENFLKEFTSLVNDKVKNVRIQMAKVLRDQHRSNPLSIQNPKIQKTVLTLKNDVDRDVRSLIQSVPLPEELQAQVKIVQKKKGKPMFKVCRSPEKDCSEDSFMDMIRHGNN